MFQGLGKKLLILFLVFSFFISGFDPASLFLTLTDVSKNNRGKNIVDKIYLAKQNPNVVDNFRFGVREAQAAEDPNELEYAVDIGPVAGSTAANYVYASFFNPTGSGRTAVIKRIAVRANAVAAALYQNVTIRRTTAASAGTQIIAANIPKKHNDSSNSVTEVRHTGVTVTLAGTTNSRILSQAAPGAAGQFHSYRDITFGASDEKLVIQPGEGIALYQEAAGTVEQRIRLYIEWEEVASPPTAQTEFLFAFPRVENAAAANYVYNSFFNPAASGKTAIVKRIWFGAETCDTIAVYTNNIVLRRISAASAGTAITAADVPKKHSGSATSAMDLRHTTVTVTMVGGTDARLGFATPCRAAGQPQGFQQILFAENDEKLILQPGQGIALMADAAGDVDQLVRMVIEWQEVASGSTPASQGEYILALPRIEVAATANQNFYAFFNPVASGKTAVVKKLGIRINADTTAVYSAFTWRRITAASGGVAITATDRPKKHTGTADSVMTTLWCGAACATAISVTLAGDANSRLLTVNGPGAAGQIIGQREITFSDNERLILQPGEGIAFYIEAAGDVDHYIKTYLEWDEETTAPTSQGEYLIGIGPIAGSTASGYNYASFFNPSASGKTAIVKRVEIRVDAAAAALYIPMTLRRTTAASAGTLVTLANVPKKHTGTATTIMEVRHTGPTVTLAGTADSRLTSVQTPGAVGSAVAPSLTGYKEFLFENDERIILQPGQGIALYQEAAGDADFRVKVLIEWQEVASGSTPASQGEYLMSAGPVAGSLTSGYVYGTIFNPSTSGKNYVVKRIEIRTNRIGALTAPGYIPATIRRTTAASAGTQIAAANIPKKHTDTTDATAEIRHTGPSVTFAGVTDSRLLGVTVPGAVNQFSGDLENVIVYQDELILKPGEGLALYQEAAAGDALVRFRFNFEWSESDVPGVITVNTTGSQATNLNIPSTNNNVGGAFTFVRSAGTANVTQIIITDTGTVNANLNLSNVVLFFKTEAACSTSIPGDATQYNTTGVGFNASEKATVTGAMTVGASQICLYVRLDVGSGASANQTLEIEISNPSTEVTVSAGTVTPNTAVAIAGTTTLILGQLSITSPASAAFPAKNVSTVSQNSVVSISYVEVSDSRAGSPGWSATMTSQRYTTRGGVYRLAGNNSTVGFSGTYTGSYGVLSPVGTYTVEITTGGGVGVAIFKWTSPLGTLTENVITASTVALNAGISVNFGAATYQVGDKWQIAVDVFPYTGLYATPSDITLISGSLTGVSKGVAEYLTGSGDTSNSKTIMSANVGYGTGVYRQDEGLDLIIHINSLAGDYSAVVVFTAL